ncbi:hypothetical protein [Streptomyces pactum]|uniref:Uncharacterized protein n=1 Tax=Streptomyces pactum TaxID=68249 RepID=A0A1S6JGN4_9ACTN|nr:hypothetical protein [Streptomyces pactum]AQS70889.1 hypothetical protein B1H29_31925 [Streptomyces pactum]
MTGPEHYREAERLLQGLMTERGNVYVEEGNEQVIGIAQAHATLALAAATALGTPDRSVPVREAVHGWAEWQRAAGVSIPEEDDE